MNLVKPLLRVLSQSTWYCGPCWHLRGGEPSSTGIMGAITTQQATLGSLSKREAKNTNSSEVNFPATASPERNLQGAGGRCSLFNGKMRRVSADYDIQVQLWSVSRNVRCLADCVLSHDRSMLLEARCAPSCRVNEGTASAVPLFLRVQRQG